MCLGTQRGIADGLRRYSSREEHQKEDIVIVQYDKTLLGVYSSRSCCVAERVRMFCVSKSAGVS